MHLFLPLVAAVIYVVAALLVKRASDLGADIWRTPFDPAQPLTTPRDLDIGRPEVRTALADAVEAVTAAHLPLDAPIEVAQRYRSIGLHGCTEAEGCFNVIQPAGGLDPTGHYPDVASATSFSRSSPVMKSCGCSP